MAMCKEIETWRNKKRQSRLENMDREVKEAIEEQRDIGWKNFLEGLVCNKITRVQQEYLNEKKSYMNSHTWVKKVIKAGWELIENMWEFRNEAVHEKEKIKELEGVPVLDRCIREQWNRGLGQLPASEYSCMFRIKEEEIIKQQVESKKKWLATVKMARKLHRDEEQREDEFDKNTALRKWIGIE